jgi:endonuclease/exonuclease/phosphatase family metal-dependent hydrolase
MRVMTYNIRNSGAGDGPNRWELRRDLWIQIVRQFDPDLLGVQEVLADQYDDLKEQFPDYTLVGVARDDGKRLGEWSLILFRTARFAELGRWDFWFSSTPHTPGSIDEDAACPRLCSCVRLRDNITGRNIRFCNLHLDHQGERSRMNAVQQLRALVVTGSSLDLDPVILVGDFNCTERDAPYSVLTQEAGFTDSYRTCHPVIQKNESSFHHFSDSLEGLRIDWILHQWQLRAVAAEIDRTRGPYGQFASDHDPVTAVLQWVDEK